MGDSRGRDLTGGGVFHRGSRGKKCRIRPMIMKALGKGLRVLGPGQVSSDAHADTQAHLAPSDALCPVHLALTAAGLVPLLGTALGAHCRATAQPSSPGSPCW